MRLVKGSTSFTPIVIVLLLFAVLSQADGSDLQPEPVDGVIALKLKRNEAQRNLAAHEEAIYQKRLLAKETVDSKRDIDSDHMAHMGQESTNDSAEHFAISNLAAVTATEQSSTSTTFEPIPHVEHHMHGVPIMQTHLEPEELAWWNEYNKTESYFKTDGKTSFLWGHIFFVWGSFTFLYPISMICNNVASFEWQMVTIFTHSISVVVGIICYWIFMGSLTKVIYPGNAYNPMTLLLFVTNACTLLFAVFRYSFIKFGGSTQSQKFEYEHLNDQDSGAISILLNLPRMDRANSEDSELISGSSEAHHFKAADSATIESSRFKWAYGNKLVASISRSIGTFSFVLFSILQWGQFIYFLIYLPTGVAVFLNLGQGPMVFNLLAHFIKGGVFILYGIVSLARYCGAWQNKSWAWNNKYIASSDLFRSRWARIQPRCVCSMEMIECSLILFYGCTNVFLEHLSNIGKPYSAKDLQHASIAFIFIGCGLCGILTEIKSSDFRFERAMGRLLNHSESDRDVAVDVAKVVKAGPGFSPNPFPVLTIYWTGYLMSKHMQTLSLSTEIHIQWGNLFMLGCVFRLLTYFLSMLVPPQKSKLTDPRRPFTELLVSFSLICGGLIFMESTNPIIYIFEFYGFTSMFTLNVSLGVVTLFMAWEMLLFTFRDWMRAKVSLQS